MSECNGWSNRETWSAALTIGNDESIYRIAKCLDTYESFVEYVINVFDIQTTGEGYRWDDPKIDTVAMDSLIAELKDH